MTGRGRGIGSWENTDGVEFFIEVLSDDSAVVRASAAESLWLWRILGHGCRWSS